MSAVDAPQPAPPAPRTAERVVVIDDNDELRDMIVDALEMEAYAVEQAADGTDDLTRILSARPNAALIDIGLPGLDGYEVARRARRAW